MNDRARVPFALVGVLLLVGGAGVNASLGGIDPPGDPAAERAVEQATAAARTALEGAAVDAGRTAAAAPVVDPATSPAGRLVDEPDPFRAYLRLLVYRYARQRLSTIDERDGAVRATVSLPRAESVSALARAKDRVRIARAGPNGTAMRVSIENVTVTVRRDGKVVSRQSWNATVIASTPVLAVHDRVSKFEQRLNAGPLDPGLGRRLTARLYAVAWARGYAQYGGSPIANVVATRHVGLATNGAVLALQRRTLGTSEPTAHRAMRQEALEVARRDVLAGAGVDGRLARSAFGVAGVAADAAADTRTLSVGVGATADTALADVLDSGAVADAMVAAYTADARLATRVERVETSRAGTRKPTGAWSLVDSRVERHTSVRAGDAPLPAPTGRWHTLDAYSRVVERKRVTVREWERDNRTATTRTVRRRVDRVGVAVLGRHRARRAPARPVQDVHRNGTGALDGPNLADVRRRAVAALVTEEGGPDALAARAAEGDLSTAPQSVTGSRPSGLHGWAVSDLAVLRDRVQNVSVDVERGAIGTFAANPPERLAAAVERQRSTLLNTPSRYAGVADRARIAARSVYLDAVVATLEARADAHRDRRTGLTDALGDDWTPETLDRVRQTRHVTESRRPTTGGLGGPVGVTVRGDPTSLELTGNAPSLATRNVNYVTVPYGDVADTIVGSLFGPRRVRLDTAARTLRAANDVESRTGEDVEHRAELQQSVRYATSAVKERLRATLRREGIGTSARDRRRLVAVGFSRWETTSGQALAAANGSVVSPLLEAIETRYPTAVDTPRERELLALRLRVALQSALASARGRPQQPPTNRTTSALRGVAREQLAAALGNASDAARKRWRGEVLGAVPAGLPVAPVPGQWYATANVWRVDVRGEYERFAVRSRRGVPRPDGAGVAYVRDGSTVRFDVDGDGSGERLGHARRVSFETRTVVVVVVPPGGRGVGDTDGNADERSAGWGTM